MAELIDYLKSAGYIEKNNRADASRSRYWVDSGKLIVEPGMTGMIDGNKAFPALAVKFNKDGKSVDAIADLNTRNETEKARLEPKMLSTIAAEGDGRRKIVNFADIPPHLDKGDHGHRGPRVFRTLRRKFPRHRTGTVAAV